MAWGSIFHDGNSLLGDTGDVGPIPGLSFSYLMRGILCGDTTKEGVFTASDEFDGFAVSGSSSPLLLSSGVAIVHGCLVYSTADTAITVATPGTTRKDRLVLQYSSVNKQVRPVLLTGTSIAYPSLTQIAGKWEIPLYKIDIDAGGTITLTDERYPPEPRIMVTHEMMEPVQHKILIPASSCYNRDGSAEVPYGNSVPGWPMPDAVWSQCRAMTMCPHDLAGPAWIEALVYSPSISGNLYSINTWSAGEQAATWSEDESYTGPEQTALTAAQYDTVNMVILTEEVAKANPIWHLDFSRRADNVLDEIGGIVYFGGFQITYDGTG